MEISPKELSDLVQVEVEKQLAAIKANEHALAVEWGRVAGRIGGKVRNPRKGFGTGDNARRAVEIRWAKYRAKQQAV